MQKMQELFPAHAQNGVYVGFAGLEIAFRQGRRKALTCSVRLFLVSMVRLIEHFHVFNPTGDSHRPNLFPTD
jgi:hypothetical protein